MACSRPSPLRSLLIWMTDIAGLQSGSGRDSALGEQEQHQNHGPRKSFHSNSAEKMPTVIGAGRLKGTTATC